MSFSGVGPVLSIKVSLLMSSIITFESMSMMSLWKPCCLAKLSLNHSAQNSTCNNKHITTKESKLSRQAPHSFLNDPLVLVNLKLPLKAQFVFSSIHRVGEGSQLTIMGEGCDPLTSKLFTNMALAISFMRDRLICTGFEGRKDNIVLERWLVPPLPKNAHSHWV